MTWKNTLEVGATVVGSLGGGGLIVFGLSGFLGKVWANRLMASERLKHDRNLEELRNLLRGESEKALRKMESDLEIYRERFLKTHRDKVDTYRLAVDIVATILADFDRAHRLSPSEAFQAFDSFNRDRVRLYGYLAMMVPQEVMDAQDVLVDHLLLITNGSRPYEWTQVRSLGIKFINAIRKDLSIDPHPIEYRGAL